MVFLREAPWNSSCSWLRKQGLASNPSLSWVTPASQVVQEERDAPAGPESCPLQWSRGSRVTILRSQSSCLWFSPRTLCQLSPCKHNVATLFMSGTKLGDRWWFFILSQSIVESLLLFTQSCLCFCWYPIRFIHWKGCWCSGISTIVNHCTAQHSCQGSVGSLKQQIVSHIYL